MKTELKANAERRLKRISGQVSGIQRMVEGDRTCDEILQQVAAVRSALEQLGVLLLTEHLQTCVLHQDVEGETDCCAVIPAGQRSQRIKDALSRFLK